METQSNKHDTQDFKLSTSDFTILDFKKNWNWMFDVGSPTNLNQIELAEIETILKLAVKENNEKQKLRLEKSNQEFPNNVRKQTGFEITLNEMKRQYVPIINPKGEKEIWINLFCDDFGNDTWKYTLMEVSDGGNCFFNVKVNLENKTYSRLIVNGYG